MSAKVCKNAFVLFLATKENQKTWFFVTRRYQAVLGIRQYLLSEEK